MRTLTKELRYALTPSTALDVLPGFGELFRVISLQQQNGTAAIITRALAGGVNGKLIVSLPGSTAAVELALTTILLPDLQHLMHELRR